MEGEPPTTEFPVFLQAWQQALSTPTAVLPEKLQTFLSEPDPAVRKEITREIYDFLHAQQLCAMTAQLSDMNERLNQRLNEMTKRAPTLPPTPPSSQIIKGVFLFVSGLLLGCAACAAFTLRKQ